MLRKGHEPEEEQRIQAADNSKLAHLQSCQQEQCHSSTKQKDFNYSHKDLGTEVTLNSKESIEQAKISLYSVQSQQSAFIDFELLVSICNCQSERIFQTQAITAPSFQYFAMRKLIEYHKRNLAELRGKVTHDNFKLYLRQFQATLRKFQVTNEMLTEYYAELSSQEYQKLMKRKAFIEYDRSRLQYHHALHQLQQNTTSKAPKIEQQSERDQGKVKSQMRQMEKSHQKDMQRHQHEKGFLSKIWNMFSSSSQKKTQ